MTPESIRRELESYLNSNWTLTPIAWDGFIFDPESVSSYIAPTVNYGKAFIGEIGSGGVGHRVGSFFISICVPPNTGTATASSYAGLLESMFRKSEFGGVVTNEVEIGNGGINTLNNKYQVNVKIAFNTFIGE